MLATTSPPGNRLLASLSEDDRRLLASSLQPVNLPVRRPLEARNRRIDYVYFLDCGIASVVASSDGHGDIEIGIIGREGVTGLAVIMGTDRSPHECYMQMEGAGYRISAQALRNAMLQSETLRQCLLKSGYAFALQTAETALVNGRHKLEERLARWLLMAHDRADGDDLSLTHEFLARMLGVRRPGVSVAVRRLEQTGLIRAQRGGILVLDREGLEESSNGAYGTTQSLSTS
jgi:CRP-like cAMP-binding protein